MACVLGCAHAICRRLRTQTFAHCARCVHCAQGVCGWRRTVHRRLQMAMTEVWLCVSITCILVQVAADLIQARIRTS